MADSKLTALGAATVVTAADKFYMVEDTGVAEAEYKTAASIIKDYMKIADTDTGGPAAGYISEYKETVLDAASAVTFTSNVAKTITSVDIDAGDWDVDFMAQFACAVSSCTNILAGLNTTTDTLPSDTTGGLRSVLAVAITDNTTPSLVGLSRRFTVAATTTIYMVGRAGFSGTAVTGYGRIRARRVR